MFVTKKRYLNEIEALHQDYDTLRGRLRAKDQEARDRRASYECAVSSPEIKADTESAFKRGEAMQRAKFKSWLHWAASQIDAQEPGEETTPDGDPT